MRGLICSSACLGGELPQAIMHDDLEEASRIVEEFKEIFGEDYYLNFSSTGHSPAHRIPIRAVIR